MTTYAGGSLVAARGREWVVLPDSPDDFLVLRPHGGTDDDVAGVLPAIEPVAPASFPPPTPDDLGDDASARLLRSALRIGFRSSAGPFRSLGNIAVGATGELAISQSLAFGGNNAVLVFGRGV